MSYYPSEQPPAPRPAPPQRTLFTMLPLLILLVAILLIVQMWSLAGPNRLPIARLDPAAEPAYPRFQEYLVLLRLMIVDGRAELALDAIEPAQRNATRAGRVQDLLDLLLLRAIAEQTMGHGVAAERCLQQALKIGEPERFTRTFIDFGSLLAPVLELHANGAVIGDYTWEGLALSQKVGQGS